MPYFSVAFHVDATGHCIVEADDDLEAQAIAEARFCADSDNTEIGDAQEVVSVSPIKEDNYSFKLRCNEILRGATE